MCHHLAYTVLVENTLVVDAEMSMTTGEQWSTVTTTSAYNTIAYKPRESECIFGAQERLGRNGGSWREIDVSLQGSVNIIGRRHLREQRAVGTVSTTQVP